MPSFHINDADGAVKLPNGVCITEALAKDVLLADPNAANVRTDDYGTLPWMHYHFRGGEVEGKPLLVSLCFYDQLLVYVSITADLYPPGPKDWSNYSLDVEVATKRFHEQLLTKMFTNQPESADFSRTSEPSGRDLLHRPLSWRFPWGVVGSFHDSKGGGTYIHVSYGDLKDKCNRKYRMRR